VRSPFKLRFARDVAATSATQVVKAALAMVAGIVVARYYGAAGRGTVSVLVALASMTILLGTLGLHGSSIYFMGRRAEQSDEIVSNNVVVGTVGGVLCAIGLLVVGLLFRPQLLGTIPAHLFFVSVLAVPFMYFNSFAQRIILGAGRVTGFNVSDVVEGLGLLIGTAAAILAFGHDLVPLVGLRVVIEVLIAAALVVYLRRITSPRFAVNASILREQLAYGLRNYASSLLWLFLLQSDIVLCNHYLGSAQTGIYSVAVSLGLPVTMIANAVGTLTFQRTSAQPSRSLRVANTNRTLRVLTPLVALPMVAYALVIDPIVKVLYGTGFERAGTVLILLLPGLFAFSIEIVLINFLGGEGSPAIVYLAPLAGLAVNVVANLYVIPRWGISGAAVTSSVGYSIVLLLLLAYYLRATRSPIGQLFLVRRSDLRLLFATAPAAGIGPDVERSLS
jgi:O-antigen/teichoic acid export membrane protein